MFLLDPEKLPAELLALVKHRNLALGERLHHRGDRALAVFAVERGRLHLLSQSSDGRPVTIYVAPAGECVSEAALFADNYCSDAVAETASRVAAFPKKPLLEVLRKQPELSEEFMAMLAKRFNALRVRLELRNLQSARERVLQYLSLELIPGNNVLALDRPLRYIAEDLGLAPESFYRTLAQLSRDGCIARNGRSIRINFQRRPKPVSDSAQAGVLKP
jgi:CRP/FNR family transcriptional regulator, dissimilatory nitrate respiration regulator